MEKLALEVFDRDGSGSKFAFLPSDTRIHITETSELFDSGDIWSHEFKLNIPANAHIFGTSGELHGSRLHDLIDKRRARLWILSLPVYYGYLRLDDEVDVDSEGNIDVYFDSGRKTFIQMVDGVKANQVPVPDDILIGMALDRERTLLRSEVVLARWRDGAGRQTWNQRNCTIKNDEGFTAQMYPKFVVPNGDWKRKTDTKIPEEGQLGTKGLVNTDMPYDDEHPYCNTMICYQKKRWVENGSDTLGEEKLRKYKVSSARRINPAPNFYILYWLKILMAHLGIHVVENQMLDVEDLKRLFFVNTKCAYKTKGDTWYQSGNKLMRPTTTNANVDAATPFVPIQSNSNESWKVDMEVLSGRLNEGRNYFQQIGRAGDANTQLTWHKAYATSDNFPDVEIKDVIESIENGFGVRFLFNSDYTKVRIVLLRNVFRSHEVHEIGGITTGEHRIDNCIRGFRLTYGGDSSNTSYNYKGFELAKQSTEGGWIEDADDHDYTKWNTSEHYSTIKGNVGTLNKTCYIDSTTGNSYIVKIDENFRNAADKPYPSLFECHQWADAEDGDCTGSEETIKECRIGFVPMNANAIDDYYALFVDAEMGVPYNDASISYDMPGIDLVAGVFSTNSAGGTEHNGTSDIVAKDIDAHNGLFEIATETYFVATTDGTNEVFTINDYEQGGDNATVKIHGWIKEGYRIYLNDNYKPNDDMESPLEKTEWGLTIGIMRGSKGGPSIKYFLDSEEGEGNSSWYYTPDNISTAHSDICDDKGNPWDYYLSKTSGSTSATQADGKISLKLRAEKPNPFFDPSKPEGSDNLRYLEITNSDLKHRGLADKFHKEESYWWRNSRIVNKERILELSDIIGIDKTVRQKVDDVIGFVQKLQYTVHIKNGLSPVNIELRYI